MGRKWSEVKGEFRKARASATVCARADLAGEIEELRVRYEQARDEDQNNGTAADEPQAPKILEEMKALRQQMADSQVTFTFEALGRKRESDLMAEHPPTAEQVEYANKRGFQAQLNPETHVPAMFFEACIDPAGMTVEDWTEIYNEWSPGEVAKLYRAVSTVNQAAVEVPKVESGSDLM